jgi:UDP-N-acetylglucosamine 4-epimerase
MRLFFSSTYGLETIGLRVISTFWSTGSNGAYAAVIPKFVMQLMNHERLPVTVMGIILDFTYIDNVIQMNALAMGLKSRGNQYGV